MSPDDVRRATHRELVEEAERRGIANAEWMEREVLVRGKMIMYWLMVLSLYFIQ